MAMFEPMQPATKKMENEKKIADHEHGINRELNQKCAQGLGSFLSHFLQMLRIGLRSWSRAFMEKVKFHCAETRFP